VKKEAQTFVGDLIPTPATQSDNDSFWKKKPAKTSGPVEAEIRKYEEICEDTDSLDFWKANGKASTTTILLQQISF
jgi:hypothetical protein